MATPDPHPRDHAPLGSDEVTHLLRQVERGDPRAQEALFARIYPDLKRMALRKMSAQNAGHTLQATALVNEAFLRIVKCSAPSFNSRKHFLLVASRAMRHVLIDHARTRGRIKRDGRRIDLPVDEIVAGLADVGLDMEALGLALDRLRARDPEMAKAIELRYFTGTEEATTARILGIPQRSFQRRWRATKDWLRSELEGDAGGEAPVLA